MNRNSAIRVLYVLAALYDGLLGLTFLFGATALFQWCDVTPPNHFGYIQFPAALLIVFALMFAAIAKNPAANRNLIPYGILLKISYCSVAFYHWFSTGIPNMWKPFAVIDLVFLALFVWTYVSPGKQNSD